MNAKRIIAQVIELVAPEKVAEIKRRNRVKRAYMQDMLDLSRGLKDQGLMTFEIDGRLAQMLRCYNDM